MNELENKIKASLYGFFAGDALGVPVEFKPREYFETNKITGMTGFGLGNWPEGTWSDDSSMVLATIDGLVNAEEYDIDFTQIMMNFLKWKEEGEYTPFKSAYGMGSTTKDALEKYKENLLSGKPEDVVCGSSDFKCNGNGSLMRILPISLYFYTLGCDYSNKGMLDLIKKVSSMTHAHPISTMACYIYTLYLLEILRSKDKLCAYYWVQKIIKFNPLNYDFPNDAFHKIINNDITKLPREEINSSGFVVDTLEASFWATLTSNSFEEAILNAVNLGGDTDTIAALTGSMSGIIYGLENIPESWINTLQRKDFLDEKVESFTSYLNQINDKKRFNINPIKRG